MAVYATVPHAPWNLLGKDGFYSYLLMPVLSKRHPETRHGSAGTVTALQVRAGQDTHGEEGR